MYCVPLQVDESALKLGASYLASVALDYLSEAAQLQADLRRAGVEPFAWVINSSLAASGARDPLLRSRAAIERRQIDRVQQGHARRVAVVPWAPVPPVGAEHLAVLAGVAPPASG